jgi:hypothetical protein
MEKFDYQEQADDFMKKTGATMETKLLGNFPYFDGDKEPRDVYQITITRQIAPTKEGNNSATKIRYSFRFGQSISESKKRKAPTSYDILACVQKSDPGTFSDFCGDFGYDEDSRKAEKTYFAVQKEWKGIESIFGDVIEELQEIN